MGFCNWLMAFVVLKVGRAENVKGLVAWVEVEELKYFSSASNGNCMSHLVRSLSQ